MKPTSFLPAMALAFLALPLTAWADRNPDFDDDAAPILRMQPGLLEYVESRFEVKDTGKAKFPGNDERRPMPPYMFRARPRGEPGPYNLMLLIQPGPVNHILNVVDMTKVQLHPPSAVASQPAPTPTSEPEPKPPANPAPATVSQTPPPSAPSQPAQTTSKTPTSDTPSGPITTAPSLEPPPDPAPAAH